MSACRRHLEDSKGIANYTFYGNTNFQYCYIAENYPGHIEYDSKQIVVANVDIEVAARNGFLSALDTVNTTEEIIALTMKLSNEKRYRVYGLKPYLPTEEVDYIQCDDEGDLLEHFLSDWVKTSPDGMTGWNITSYDIPYMYNRITKRLDKKRANKLSPFGQVRQVTLKRFDQEYISYRIAGVNNLDYQALYRKNVLEPLESYRLDYISEIELKERKLDYSEYRNLWEMYEKNHQKFIEYNIHDVRLVDKLEAKKKIIELQQIVAYRSKVNMEDVMSQTRTWDAAIYNHLRDRGIVVPMRETEEKDTQYAGAFVKDPVPNLYKWIVSFDVNSLYPSLIAALNIGVETKQDRKAWDVEQSREIKRMSAGLMLQRPPNWDLFEGHNITMGANGATYDKSRDSIFTTMIVELLQARKEYRKIADEAEKEREGVRQKLKETPGDPDLIAEESRLDYLVSDFELKQKMTKVLNNSLYGCLGNETFRYYDTENAEAITVSGQFVIQYVESGINKLLNRQLKTENVNYIIAADTDSNYIHLEALVNKYLPGETDTKKIVDYIDRVCKKILEPEIDRLFAEIRDIFFHGNGNFLAMKREVIADKGIWTKKKRYVLSIWDKEGIRYAKPKLKYTGLEVKRSTTPKCCREAIARGCEIILHGTEEEMYQFVDEFHEKFINLPVPEIAFPKGVKNLAKYTADKPADIPADSWFAHDDDDDDYDTKTGTPQHVKASLLYNYLIEQRGLQSVYSPILEGEKIKYVYLKPVNPTQQNSIAFPDGLPKEFGLDKYIDREVMYEKGFLEPLKRISEAARWSLKKTINIESLFG